MCHDFRSNPVDIPDEAPSHATPPAAYHNRTGRARPAPRPSHRARTQRCCPPAYPSPGSQAFPCYNQTSLSSNTAKLSSQILLPRTVSYDEGTHPPRRGSATYKAHPMAADAKSNRRRRSSSILQVYHEPQEPIEQLSDQSALPNLNANWVNAKGETMTARP